MPSTSTLAKDPTRTRILRSARRLIEERGFPEVGLERIASSAGVSRQAVYLHFGSRVGLLLDLVEHVDRAEGLGTMRDAVWEARSGSEALGAYVQLFMTLTPRVLGVALALETARRTDGAARTAWADRSKRRWATCDRVAGLLAAERSLRDGLTRKEAADLLWTLTSARSYEELVIERRWTRRKVARIIERSLLNDR